MQELPSSSCSGDSGSGSVWWHSGEHEAEAPGEAWPLEGEDELQLIDAHEPAGVAQVIAAHMCVHCLLWLGTSLHCPARPRCLACCAAPSAAALWALGECVGHRNGAAAPCCAQPSSGLARPPHLSPSHQLITPIAAAAFLRRVEWLRQWLEARPESSLALVSHWGVLHALTGDEFANCEVRTLRLGDLRARPHLLRPRQAAGRPL